MDFAFDPFDTCRIVVCKLNCVIINMIVILLFRSACEDAKLRVWTIPTGGLTEVLTEPKYLIG